MTLYLLFAFVCPVIIVLLLVPPIINVSLLKHLFDEPSEDRKIHIYKTPNLGGVAIFAGLILTICLVIPSGLIAKSNYLIASSFILFTLGIKDDLVGISPLVKFTAQCFSAFILTCLAGIRLTSLYGFLGIYDVSYPLSILISIVTILLIINAFNLIDGIDCLAGTIGTIVSFTFAFCFYFMNEWGLACLALSLAGSIAGFLRYNLSPARIFMGDTGSLLIGLVVAIFAIKFIELNKFDMLLNPHPFYASAPAIVVGILIIPIFDTMRIFSMRIAKGVSPFMADRNHIHHRIIDLNYSHMQAATILSLINIIFIAIVFLIQSTSTIELILFIAILAISINMIFSFFYNKNKLIALQTSAVVDDPEKVIPLIKSIPFKKWLRR